MAQLNIRTASEWISHVDIFYPIGTMYCSTKNISPASLFGGQWVQIVNAVIRAGLSIGYGGNDAKTLTVDEMPSHAHTEVLHADTQNYHNGGTAYGYVHTGALTSFSGTYTSAVGGGKAFSILPRYYNIYTWVRTA